MEPRIHLVRRLNSVVVVLAYNGDQAIWTKARLRKGKRCELTGEDMKPGTEVYRPVGNQMYRMCRIKAEALEQAVDSIEKAHEQNG